MPPDVGFGFKSPGLLETALTHSSYANELKGGVKSNERLEFLGDAILDMIISEKLYSDYPGLTEGELTKTRANLVCEPNLAKKARGLGLGAMLRMGKGELNSGGSDRDSILCDVFEAVLGAVFLDGGYEAVKNYALPMFSEDIGPIIESSEAISDPKSFLQEELQKTSADGIEYRTVAESGPDHEKIFTVEAHYQKKLIGSGTGKSKKEAAQNAASDAIKKLGFM